MKIVIAEDQGMLRDALVQLLEMEQDIEVIGKTEDGEKALSLVESGHPDLLIADIEMPGMSGLDVAEQLHEENSPCKVVIVTTFARPGYLERAMKACVSGYILKDEPIEDLIRDLRSIILGKRVISSELAETFYLSGENPLTEREIEVLRQAAKGLETRTIAKTLHLSQGTVRNYLSVAIQKTEAKNRQEAIVKAENEGWI